MTDASATFAFVPPRRTPAECARNVRRRPQRRLDRAHQRPGAHDHVQGNVVILPQALAPTTSCATASATRKPCPLLAVSEPGDPTLPTLGADIDIRTDLPRYRVWRDGELVDEPTDIARAVARRPA